MTPDQPETAVLITELRLLAAEIRKRGRLRVSSVSNLALLAAARLEEMEAGRLMRHANATAGAFARAQNLTPARRREIAMHAHATKRKKKSYQVAS